MPIRIPNLSDRVDDIPALVNHFLKKYGKKFGIARGIADSAMEYLQQLSWPGNIRELENSVQRLIISAKGEDISLMDVMHETHGDLFEGSSFGAEEEESAGQDSSYPIDPELSLQEAVDEYEKGLIKYACEKYGSTRQGGESHWDQPDPAGQEKKKYNL